MRYVLGLYCGTLVSSMMEVLGHRKISIGLSVGEEKQSFLTKASILLILKILHDLHVLDNLPSFVRYKVLRVMQDFSYPPYPSLH